MRGDVWINMNEEEEKKNISENFCGVSQSSKGLFPIIQFLFEFFNDYNSINLRR